MVGKTMAEKILAKVSGQSAVSVGDVVMARLHVVSLLDVGTHFRWVRQQNLKVWDPARVVICFDHFMSGAVPDGAGSWHAWIREFAREQGIPRENVYDIGRHGLSHQVPAEEGWVLPGTFYAACDTEGATMGAFNCFALPLIKSTAAALVTGDVWVSVPESIQVTFRGKLNKGVSGKDIFFRLLNDLKEVADGRVLEFGGPGLESLPIDLRMTVANGSNHMGAVTSIFEADRTLIDFLAPIAREPFEIVTADGDAEYVGAFVYDLSEFDPLVSGPGEITNLRPLAAVEGVTVHAAYIGSCSAGRLEDLKLAAQVLDGRRVHRDVRLVVTPISSRVMRQAADLGLLSTFAAAGATVTMPGCGACFSPNQSPLRLDDGEVCISSSVDNYAGRMGSDKSQIYLANTAVVAASAIEGRIANPSKYL